MSEQSGLKSESARPATLTPEGAYSEDGVDLTLIRWMLSLTPSERLRVLQQSVSSLQRLRDDHSQAWVVSG